HRESEISLVQTAATNQLAYARLRAATCVQPCLFFFFQAEDGIRDKLVTGVQTCALPIYPLAGHAAGGGEGEAAAPERRRLLRCRCAAGRDAHRGASERLRDRSPHAPLGAPADPV